jgi:uncharacterized integral membrane protein
MLALGLLLFVVSGVVGLAVVLDNTDSVSMSAFGLTIDNVSLGGVFLAGAVAGLVFMLGLAMMAAGGRKRREQRKTVKVTRREKVRLETENAELRAKVAEPYPADEPAASTYTEGRSS